MCLPDPQAALPGRSQVLSTHGTSGRTSSRVVLGGVLFESGSKTCKRDKAEKCVWEMSTPVVCQDLLGTWFSALPETAFLVLFQISV